MRIEYWRAKNGETYLLQFENQEFPDEIGLFIQVFNIRDFPRWEFVAAFATETAAQNAMGAGAVQLKPSEL